MLVENQNCKLDIEKRCEAQAKLLAEAESSLLQVQQEKENLEKDMENSLKYKLGKSLVLFTVENINCLIILPQPFVDYAFII